MKHIFQETYTKSKIIAISGSPAENSKIDRLIQAVLSRAGMVKELVKLSKNYINPMHSVSGCTGGIICNVIDEFRELAEKVKRAGAIVVSGYSSLGALKCSICDLLSSF